MTWNECTRRLNRLVLKLRAAQDGARHTREHFDETEMADDRRQLLLNDLAVIDAALTDSVDSLAGFEDVRPLVQKTVMMPADELPSSEG